MDQQVAFLPVEQALIEILAGSALGDRFLEREWFTNNESSQNQEKRKRGGNISFEVDAFLTRLTFSPVMEVGKGNRAHVYVRDLK